LAAAISRYLSLNRPVQLPNQRKSVTVTPTVKEITIKELHEKTGELVRQAGESRDPVSVTDRGKIVAVLGSPKLIKSKRVKRGLPKQFLAFIKSLPPGNVQEDMDEVRGDR
jgi:antitoxin (DNA-binding transcriptional repressor) of toxin-antitoxin stability system